MKVVVTGSERGIGKEIARELSRRGHFFYSFSRFNDIDVSNYECVKNAFKELEDEPPDAIINNAGIVRLGSIFELTEKEWKEQFDVNLNGVFYCSKEYARIAKDKGGKTGKVSLLSKQSGSYKFQFIYRRGTKTIQD